MMDANNSQLLPSGDGMLYKTRPGVVTQRIAGLRTLLHWFLLGGSFDKVLHLLLSSCCCGGLLISLAMVDPYMDLNQEWTSLDEDSIVPSSQPEEVFHATPTPSLFTLTHAGSMQRMFAPLHPITNRSNVVAPASNHVAHEVSEFASSGLEGTRNPCVEERDAMSVPKSPPIPNKVNMNIKLLKVVKKRIKIEHAKKPKKPKKVDVPRVVSQPSIVNSIDCNAVEEDVVIPMTQEASSERGTNWVEAETLVLLEGKKRLSEDMQSGILLKTLKSRKQRWEFVAKFLLDMGFEKTPSQCEYRWGRLWKPFKQIYDYEKAIPSGCESYWKMTTIDRTGMKFPRSFDSKVYAAMKDRFAGDWALDLGDILIDTSAHHLPAKAPITAANPATPVATHVDDDEDVFEIPPPIVNDYSAGKKRKRQGRISIVKKEFEDSTKQLLDFFGGMEKERVQNQTDLMEISCAEFDTNIQLQKERITAANHSSEALMEIAGALKLFVKDKVA